MFLKNDLTEMKMMLVDTDVSTDWVEVADDILIENVKEIVDGSVVLFTDDELDAKEIEKQFLILERDFNATVDNRVRELKAFIAGKDILTTEQVERYEAKYQIALKAKDGDEDAKAILDIEAGGDSTDLIDEIIAIGSAWNISLNTLLTLLDVLRVSINNKKLAGVSYDEIETIVTNFKKLQLSKINSDSISALLA